MSTYEPQKMRSKPSTMECFVWSDDEATEPLRRWITEHTGRDAHETFYPWGFDHGGAGRARLWVEKSGSYCTIRHGDAVVLEPDGSGFYPVTSEVLTVRYEPVVSAPSDVPPAVGTGSLHSTTDAAEWAGKFMSVVGNIGRDNIDDVLMISWFANAIETGRNHHPAQQALNKVILHAVCYEQSEDDVPVRSELWRAIFGAIAANDCYCAPGDPTCADWRDSEHRWDYITSAVERAVVERIEKQST